MQKSFWQSKTVWVNLVALVAMAFSFFGIDAGLTADVQAEIVAAVMAVVNIVLRFVTDRPIGVSPGDEAE